MKTTLSFRAGRGIWLCFGANRGTKIRARFLAPLGMTADAIRPQKNLQGSWLRRRRLARLVRGRRVGILAGIVRGLRRSRTWGGKVLRAFIQLAGAHLLDCAAKFVVEGTTRAGIVAEAVKLDPDAPGFRIWRVWIVAQDRIRCARRLIGGR